MHHVHDYARIPDSIFPALMLSLTPCTRSIAGVLRLPLFLARRDDCKYREARTTAVLPHRQSLPHIIRLLVSPTYHSSRLTVP